MATETLYEIKTHEETFTEPEIFLRRELEKELPDRLRNYTTQEDLDNLLNYRKTSETFHPENHFYIFDGDQLLGFIHLWPNYSGDNNENIGEVANISLPFAKNNNEDVENALHETVIERAKSLGIKSLRISIDSEHLSELSRAERYGYNYQELELLHANLPLNVLESKLNPDSKIKVTDFDREDHGEAVKAAYSAADVPEETVERQFDWLTEMGNRLISWKVAFDNNNKLLGQGVAFIYQEEGTIAQFNVVTRGIDISDELYENTIHTIYSAHIPLLKSNNIESIDLNILSTVLDYRPLYEKLGFEFSQTDRYTKSLENL